MKIYFNAHLILYYINLIDPCMPFDFSICNWISCKSFQLYQSSSYEISKLHAVTFFFQNTCFESVKVEIKLFKPPVFISTIQNMIANMRTKFKSGKGKIVFMDKHFFFTMMVMIVICVSTTWWSDCNRFVVFEWTVLWIYVMYYLKFMEGFNSLNYLTKSNCYLTSVRECTGK